MIAIDTNVLVQLLVADDARQTAVARRVLATTVDSDARLLIPLVVLCETAWVLRAVYRQPREAIAESLTAVLAVDRVVVERAEAVERALRAYPAGRADLSDYVIRETARESGAQAVLTFDRIALAEPGFIDPDPAKWPDDLDIRETAPPYVRRRRRPSTTRG